MIRPFFYLFTPLVFHSMVVRSFYTPQFRQFSSKLYVRKKIVESNDGTSFKKMALLYKPKTKNQESYVDFLNDDKIPIVLGVGPAGSGKTLFACNQAVMALKKGTVNKIVLTRPVVPVEEDIGFLPGSLINKMHPWTRPIFDILLEFYQQKDIDGMLYGGVLEISPLAFMRGRTFKNAFIIADEMQNSSPNQMLMLTTRIGQGSKMVITGDLHQSDRGVDNGLADFIKKIHNYNDFCLKSDLTPPNIRIVEMAGIDVQRSPIVAKLLDIYSTPKKSDNSSTIKEDSPLVSEKILIDTRFPSEKPTFELKRKIDTTISNDAALLPIHHISNLKNLPWDPKLI